MLTPTNSLLSLLAAASWGVGDFSGGMSVKSSPLDAPQLQAALRVILLSHLVSFSVLLAWALARHDAPPHGIALCAALFAGVIGGTSACGFYLALSRGSMGASAAVSGLLAAALPAAFAIAHDGSPGLGRLLGFASAALAIWLIAAGPAEPEARSTILLAALAGLGFGLYFIALKFAGTQGVIWPLAVSRMGSLSACLIFLGVLRIASPAKASFSTPPRMLGWILTTALFDTAGNALFVSATRAGRLDIASVLASLYPAGTILLASVALGERPTRRQLSGMAVAVLAVILITR